ncbi:hypothetical protein PUN4_340107 [Paraburkholderia unamae]|nr:hypothetical protein PUN4_340107 [Paraburkholderia unamae]
MKGRDPQARRVPASFNISRLTQQPPVDLAPGDAIQFARSITLIGAARITLRARALTPGRGKRFVRRE